MRNPYQLISFVKNPSCNGEDCGVGEVGVVGEPFGVLTCDLGAKLFEVSRKLTGLSGRESDHLPPEERREALENREVSQAVACGIKRPQGDLAPRSREFSPQPVSPGLDVLLVGPRFKDGVSPCEPLASASGYRARVAVEQLSKEILGSLSSERSELLGLLQSCEFTQASLKAARFPGSGEPDHAIEEHCNRTASRSDASDTLRIEGVDASGAELEPARLGREPRAGKRLGKVGLSGASGSRLVDADENSESLFSHRETTNQLGGACR